MELIYQNPFRILGLPINAKDRQIAKRIGDLAIYTDMGKEIEYNVDHFFPDKPIRTPESIEEAKQKIDQPSNKLFYALFWFWENSNNTIDEVAFEELQNGNVEKAIEFWEKAIENGITAKNRSNHRNLSTLRLGLSTQGGKLHKHTFLNSLSLTGEFLANGHFEEFTTQVLGEQYNVDLLETTSHYVDEIISIAKPHLDIQSGIKTNELIEHFNDFPSNIQSDIMGKFTGQYIHNIEKQVSKSESLRRENSKKANKAGIELYKTTKDDLKQLENIFSKSNLKYQLIADKLAEEIIGCSIAYFNELLNTNSDPCNDALKLVKYAKIIAIGDKVKDRIKDGFQIMEEYQKDKPKREKLSPVKSEFDFIYKKIETLISYNGINKPAKIISFINSCTPKLKNIARELGNKDSDFIEINDIVGNVGINQCVAILNMAVEYVKKEMAYDEYSQSMTLQQIKNEVEPAFDKIGKLRLSAKIRREFNKLTENIGITPMGEDESWSNLKPKRQSSSRGATRTYSCYICSQTYATSAGLVSHKKSNHNSDDVGRKRTRTYSCYICSKTYATSSDLASHKKSNHNSDDLRRKRTEIYSCYICSKTYATSSDLANHEKSNHNSDDGGCYIATMVYGSYNAPEVMILRNFRDSILMKSMSGKMFVKTYYNYSPKFVKITKDLKMVHTIFRFFLNGLIKLIKVSI